MICKVFYNEKNCHIPIHLRTLSILPKNLVAFKLFQFVLALIEPISSAMTKTAFFSCYEKLWNLSCLDPW